MCLCEPVSLRHIFTITLYCDVANLSSTFCDFTKLFLFKEEIWNLLVKELNRLDRIEN